MPADKLEPPERAAPGAEALEQAAGMLDGESTLLLLGADALTQDNLARAGQIAEKTGCHILSEWSNARCERGEGTVFIGKVPYPIDIALKTLEPYKRIVLVGARAPIGFFAYPGKPAILTADDAEIFELSPAAGDLEATLTGLVDAVGASEMAPVGVCQLDVPEAQSGPIDLDTLAKTIARAIPENGIIVDESVTTGRSFFPATKGARRHTWLNNCGGSIGYAMPAAIGAAIACPDRPVMALVGDGSAMYTVQALWTMAREGLDITTLIFANNSYRILRGELTNVGVQNPGPRAIDMLSLDRPTIDWCEMARAHGVPGVRAETCEALEEALAQAADAPGPHLIEVAL